MTVKRTPRKNQVQWGGLWLSTDFARFDFTIGRNGAGKTVLLRNKLQSVLDLDPQPAIFIFDPKSEFEALLAAAGIDFTIINPYSNSPKSAAWRISADIKSEEEAQSCADLMYPVENQHNPFFDQAAQEQALGNFIGHIATEEKWTLLDHVRSLRDPDLIREVLEEAADENRHRLNLYQDSEGNFNRDVMSSLGNKIARLMAPARRWSKLDRDFAIEDWLEKGGILVMQRGHQNIPAVQNINRVIFNRIGQRLLDQPNTPEFKTYLLLDEFPKLGKGNEEILAELLSLGRSRGLGISLGVQSRPGITAQFGRDYSEDMIANIHNFAFLAVNDDESAEWCSKQLGEVDQKTDLTSQSESNSTQGSSSQEGTSETIERGVRRVHPSTLRNYRQFLPGYVDQIEGWIRLSALGRNIKMELPAHEVMRSLVRPGHMSRLPPGDDGREGGGLPYPKRRPK